MLSDVTYQKVDDAGLHISIQGKPLILDVDNVVVCAGQTSNNQLYTAIKATYQNVHSIGGALKAGDIDAKRAISQGVKMDIEL